MLKKPISSSARNIIIFYWTSQINSIIKQHKISNTFKYKYILFYTPSQKFQSYSNSDIFFTIFFMSQDFGSISFSNQLFVNVMPNQDVSISQSWLIHRNRFIKIRVEISTSMLSKRLLDYSCTFYEHVVGVLFVPDSNTETTKLCTRVLGL